MLTDERIARIRRIGRDQGFLDGSLMKEVLEELDRLRAEVDRLEAAIKKGGET
jgi:hypothetical protein